MDLQKRIEKLERKVAELEESVQVQPSIKLKLDINEPVDVNELANLLSQNILQMKIQQSDL